MIYSPQLFSFALAMTNSRPGNCAVVGVGVLGTSLCRQILQDPAFDGVEVTGITKTSNNHDSIREAVGNSDRFRLVTVDDCDEKFADVVFCAPPSGSEDYPTDVRKATKSIWSGHDGGGNFVFTSSGSVYGPGDQTTVDEDSSVVDPETNPRAGRLVKAENVSREAGGCVLRLAGLYTLDRGAHNYWLTSGKPITGPPDGLINLLHYDDAAGACLAALKAGPSVCKGKNFLISDGNPLSRKGICEAALLAKKYQEYSIPMFDTSSAPGPFGTGKVYDGSKSEEALDWKPVHPSFLEFMKAN